MGKPDHEQIHDTTMFPSSASLSQTARAKSLLEAGKISFDPKLHLFNVLGSGDKPYVVRLFPKEYCSCPSKGQCYHIIAVKKSIGDITETKVNRWIHLKTLPRCGNIQEAAMTRDQAENALIQKIYWLMKMNLLQKKSTLMMIC